MEIIRIALTALISIVVMMIIIKLIGKRSISQLNMFDYVNSITLGSIGAELATSDFDEIQRPLTAMLVYAAAIVILAVCSSKSLSLRRFFEGRTIILVENGKLINRNFKAAKMNLNEFLMECRLNGYFNISDIQTAVQESNGRISILPFSSARPVNPQDLKLVPGEDTLYPNIILDGQILTGNLKAAGLEEEWLKKQLKTNNIKAENIFLATCNKNGEFYYYEKQPRRDKKDMFDI